MTPSAYLFDLDGTLADSAPDLAGAANHMREIRGLPIIDYYILRKTASSGARGLLGAAFGITPEDKDYDGMAEEFLQYYQNHLTDHAQLFPGIGTLLSWLELNQVPWGIVTNKHQRFTHPLLRALHLNPDVVVCGDTLEKRKPFPEPILFALKAISEPAGTTIYVGDDLRDIQAGSSAGCFTAAVKWGYLGSKEKIEDWGADFIVRNPSELISLQLPN